MGHFYQFNKNEIKSRTRFLFSCLFLLLVLVFVFVLLVFLVLLLVLVLVIILLWLWILEDVPFNDWSPWIFQSLFPMFESGFVFLILTPAKFYFTNWIPSADQIIIANRNVKGDSFHFHFLNDENEGFIPVWIQIAALDTGLLLFTNSFL